MDLKKKFALLILILLPYLMIAVFINDFIKHLEGLQINFDNTMEHVYYLGCIDTKSIDKIQCKIRAKLVTFEIKRGFNEKN